MTAAWRPQRGWLLGCLLLSCSHPPAPAPEEDRKRLTLEIAHPADSPCALFDRGEICRDESHWRLILLGQAYREWEGARPVLQGRADEFRGRDPGNPQVSDLAVRILSDAQTPYPLPQRAMNLCAKCGVYKIIVGNRPR